MILYTCFESVSRLFTCIVFVVCFAAMRYVLGLPAMKERHKLAQVKAYLKVCADTKHPLHDKIGRETKTRLKRGTDWMTQAVQTIEEC